ncbi:MAG TPA: acetyltransferase [Burkholderiales bacterium]|nr:acetyltransferase [Burkholderiales bacterium]
MGFYDIFNGDADGLCALHQLRLAEPRESVLVTGVKRDVALLARVAPAAGDELTVLDISLDANREALQRVLHAGARVRYFDHHFAGEVPRHPLLEAHLDFSASTCTSLIVDGFLGGRHKAWAVAAAFGDNLGARAGEEAAALGLGAAEVAALRELGECLNYNAYGRDLADLHFHPADLYRSMRAFEDPLDFHARSAELGVLRHAVADDMRRALALVAENVGNRALLVRMPDEAWSRRVAGTFANALARRHADRIVALLVHAGDGYQVSLRAPEGGGGMHLIARSFEGGNGRERAAGIQFLPRADVPKLLALLATPPPA